MSATDKSYATDALAYVSAGWLGVLPVPHGRKDPLPSGYSGYNGAYPDRDKIKRWIEDGFSADIKDGQGFIHYDADTANLALRMPQTVVGIDVDAYDGKKGRECLAHAESLWGPLPPTVRSTSRLDGISGIRLYRIPAKTPLQTVIVFPDVDGQRLDGIEVCQYFHRYCMAWPSVHPDTGRRYRWVSHDGMMASTDYPLVGSLPFLPEKWLEALSRPPEEEITAHADVQAVVANLTPGLPSQRVQEVLDKALQEIGSATGGRHEEALLAQGRLLRLNHEGEPGVSHAMDQLEDVFCAAISDRTSEHEARAEWNRMLYGNRIHDKIASTPSDIANEAFIRGVPVTSLASLKESVIDRVLPSKSPQEPEIEDDLDNEADWDALIEGSVTYPPGVSAEPSEADLDDFLMGNDGLDQQDRLALVDEGAAVQTRTDWGIADLTDLLDADNFDPEQPTVGRREDGVFLLYPGKVNALVGPPESAKSWVAQYIASQEIADGHNVMYLDFEDSARGVVGRMRFLGLEREQIKQHFLYSAPKKALDQDSAAELFGNLDTHQPTFVIIDGLGAVMAMHNHEMKDNTEYIKFFQNILEPLTRTGATVTVIDHTSKSADEGNNYAIGAQAKLQMVTGVQIRVQAVKKFGRGKEGRLWLWVNKDRPGGVRENSEWRQMKKGGYELDYWATVFVDAREQPNVHMSMRFEEKAEQGAPNGEGELKAITERIVEFLEGIDHMPSKSDTVRLVRGNKDDILKGIYELELAQRIKIIDEGVGKAKRLHLLPSQELREAEDDAVILGSPLPIPYPQKRTGDNPPPEDEIPLNRPIP